MTRVLIVDDDPAQLRLSLQAAGRAGVGAIGVGDGREAMAALRNGPAIDLVILDLVMPELDGFGVLEAMAREGVSVPVIVQSNSFSVETVTSAVRLGALDFLVKPLTPERIIVSVRTVGRFKALEAAARLERGWRVGTLGSADIVGTGPEMDRVRTLALKAARTGLPVLIEGEAGTGKELVARAIHGTSERAGRPFVVFHCGTHSESSYPIALTGRPGMPGPVQQAQGGTLLLEAVDELPPTAQELVLRLLAGEGSAQGGGKLERLPIRLIATSRRRLLNAARSGTFREDLFYRLNVLPIYVPPLRERRGDIAALAAFTTARLEAEGGRAIGGLSPQALALLESYDWPGNVRQLEGALYRAAALSEGDLLDVGDFPHIVAQTVGRGEALKAALESSAPGAPTHIDQAQPRTRLPVSPGPQCDRFLLEGGDLAPLAKIERDLIAFAIEHHKGHLSQVARSLGIGRSTLYRKLAEYGLAGAERQDAA